jgi:alpha-mannosidase
VALTHAQRLDWLAVRIAELESWVAREWTDLTAWTFDGAPLAPGAPWPDRTGVHRLAHPEVPGGWDRLRLDVGGEGLVRIGGTPWGLDAEHREFPLDGRPFDLEVEIVARLPFGMPSRDARLALARAVRIDVPLERLVRRLRLVLDTARELGEDIGLVDCAAAALRELRWPSATAPYVARVAETAEMRNVWELPPGLDEHPPPLGDEAGVPAALEALAAGLARLRERHPAVGALTLTGHAHIDLAWRWPLEETRRKARRTLSTAAGLLDRHPELYFNQSTAQLLAFLEEDDPALVERLAAHARSGRFEPVGGMWVEPDCVMPAGESLVRQLLYGQRWFAGRFGAPHTVCWLPDCFGFTPALPQLLAGAGIRRFFTIKLSWSETNPFPHDLFWWEGLDGTRVLAHMFDNPHGGYNGVAGPPAALATWRNKRSRHAESLLSVGYGDGGGGPTEEMVRRVADMADLPVLPRQRFGRVDEFFDRAAVDGLPAWSGELYLELHRGTLTTQGRTKRLHRRAERDLVAAEALAALAHLAGGREPWSLEPLWRILLRNEFHDILPGSSIREVYETAEAELASVVAGAGEVAERALDELAARLEPGEGEAVVLANPDLAPRPIRAVVDGAPFTAPGTVAGLQVARVPVGEPAGALSAGPGFLENDLVRVEVGDDGTLARVYDKRADREVLDGRGNQVWLYVDKPREWDAWELDAAYADEAFELTASAVRVVEEGPHRAALRVERAFRDSRIVQDIRLWAGSPRIDFHTRFDWHDRRWLVKARFPLAVRSPRATFETAFGVVERATHRNTSWDEARFEVPAHRFADLSEPGYGVALLNDGRHGHHALGSELGLSLLRSPVWPDPLADEGEQELVYALLPHAGDWFTGGVLTEAEDLNRPLFARPARGGSAALQPLTVAGLPVALAALKALEDGGGLLLRVYEPRGARGAVQIDAPGWELAPVDLLERDDPGAPFGPFAVRSFRATRR